MKQPEDKLNTTEWAIALLAGVSAVFSVQHFMLANRVSGRAHSLRFAGGGLTFGHTADVSKMPNLEYTSFRTRRAVNFQDFHWKSARISALSAGYKVVGFSRMYFTIYEAEAIVSPELGRVTLGGFEPMQSGLQGQAFVHGVLMLEYGNGNPFGTMVRELNPTDPVGPQPVFRIAPSEDPVIALPDDVLFAFDSATIKAAAVPLLDRALVMIGSRDRGRVVIEGHTDSVGSDRYNRDLSLRRATAVKTWFVQRRLPGAQAFLVRAMGESRPIAPNKLPHGADNPEGRAKNRRVEIHFER